LADALELFWTLRGHSRENFRHVTELISHTRANTEERARILVIAGYMAQSLQDPQTAINFVDEGLTIWRTFTDARQIAVALTRRGVIGIRHGDYAGATALLTEARALFKENGGEQSSGIEHPIAAFLAQAMHEQGDHASARVLYEEGLAEARDRGDRHAVAYALRHLARLHFEAGDADRAVEFLREGLPYLAELRDRRCTPPCLEILAHAVGRREQWNRAARLFAAADALREATGMPLMRADLGRQEGVLADILRRLGRVVFDAEWTTGREMTLHQAIDYALDASLPP
jgi:tetratricopeptide (TPR) repeat protein